jgi:peptidoglycan/LPS O-acetylase OafA/YrhL
VFAICVFLVVCAVLSCVFFRLAQWHSKEADYWGTQVVTPETMIAQAALLKWTRENKTPFIEMVKGWKPPPERRMLQHV